MGMDSQELSFDLRCVFVPKAIADLLTEVSLIDDVSKRLSRLNDYVYALEKELKKIDAFKRELPLCMILVNGAIERLKEEVVQCKGRQVEEFIPLKGDSDGDGWAKRSGDFTDKKDWMSSAQLWSTPVEYENSLDTIKIQDSFLPKKSRNEEDDNEIARRSQFESWNFKKRGGAFVPFKKRHGVGVKEEEDLPIDELSLSIQLADTNYVRSGYGLLQGCMQQQQQSKKQRRCWSPELHRRFVNALQQLGGAQVATPKQIREVMQVDGLTNDEVKSHLQKYRLHVRKLPTSSCLPPNFEWLRQEECRDLQRSKIGLSGSPEGPLQLGGSAKRASATGDESMEDEEDDKSESHSWKGWPPKPIEELV